MPTRLDAWPSKAASKANASHSRFCATKTEKLRVARSPNQTLHSPLCQKAQKEPAVKTRRQKEETDMSRAQAGSEIEKDHHNEAESLKLQSRARKMNFPVRRCRMREQTAQPKAPWGSLLGYCRSLGGTGTVLLSVSLISQSRRGPDSGRSMRVVRKSSRPPGAQKGPKKKRLTSCVRLRSAVFGGVGFLAGLQGSGRFGR